MCLPKTCARARCVHCLVKRGARMAAANGFNQSSVVRSVAGGRRRKRGSFSAIDFPSWSLGQTPLRHPRRFIVIPIPLPSQLCHVPIPTKPHKEWVNIHVSSGASSCTSCRFGGISFSRLSRLVGTSRINNQISRALPGPASLFPVTSRRMARVVAYTRKKKKVIVSAR